MHSCVEILNKSGLPETTKGNFIQIQNVSNYYLSFRYSQNERDTRTKLGLWRREDSFAFSVSWFLPLQLRLHFQNIYFPISPAFHFSIVAISYNYGKVFPGAATLRLASLKPTWVFPAGVNTFCRNSFQDRFHLAPRLKTAGKYMTWVFRSDSICISICIYW